MSITAMDAAIEIVRRKTNKANGVSFGQPGFLPPATAELRQLSGADLKRIAGVVDTPKVRKPKAERVKVAGTDQDLRKRPKVFMADGSPVPADLKAKATEIYASGVRGAAYHKACAKAGIPTTKTIWVGNKLRVA